MKMEKSVLYVLGISHENSGAREMGDCAVGRENASNAEDALLKLDGVAEALVLNTCNRLEFYWVQTNSLPDETAKLNVLSAYASIKGRAALDTFAKKAFFKRNGDAVEHLFEVASGMRSQIVGETEILSQVKAAYAQAFAAGHCAHVLNTVFQKAAQCAKWVRTNTDIGRGKISIGSVSCALTERIFEDIKSASILLVGSGDAGRIVAESLAVRGAHDMTVASRTAENAEALASRIGAKSLPLDVATNSALANFDIVICASFSQKPILKTESLKSALRARLSRAMFVIDLAVPRNVEIGAEDLDDVFYYNLSDLSKIANANIQARKTQIEEAKRAISAKAALHSARLFGE